MKKLILTTAAFALLSAGAMAQARKIGSAVKANLSGQSQDKKDTPIPNRGCGTPVPSQQWDEAFNKVVEQHKAEMIAGRTTATTYTIPIIFHIIHEGEAVGVGHNISQAQVNSQIGILNADYNGTGYNTSLYSAMTNTANGKPAFYDYALAATGTNSVSPASLNAGGGIAIGVSGIYFCLATKKPDGTVLTEPGIERMSYTVVTGATKPSSSSDVQTLFDTKIKPATIWDPTKYFNVWVSDGGTSGLLGYATFPPVSASSNNVITSSQNGGSTTGSFGESNQNPNYTTVPSQTDGVWVVYTGIGSTGAVQSPYQYGRSLTHESGHWLGLRHIWGDGSCANDYCNDTPPASASNINLVSFPSPKYPFHKGTCTSAPSNATDGEMYMNFMDYSGDAELWMFTNDQVNRFHAALANSPYRSGFATSAPNLCAGVTTTSISAAFTYPSTLCVNQAAAFTDASTGGPVASWAWSVSPGTGVTVATSTVANPNITFPSAGVYTVTMAATNTVNTSSVSHTVTVGACVSSACDTMRNITAGASPYIYWADVVAPHDSGYLAGTNKYKDKAKAEMYTITLSNSKLTAIQVAIHKAGTHSVTFNVWNDNAGVPGTVIASKVVAMSALTSNAYNTITLTTPYTFTTTPFTFYVGFNIPTTSGDTIAAFCNDGTSGTPFTGFEQWSDASWNRYDDLYGSTALNNFMFPIVCPTTSTGIENNHLGSGINLFPNPNNGQFNFAVTLAEATNLNFTIVNMLGQVVYTKSENNVTNTVLSVDLSNLAKGIYYANITDSNNNKTVKKIIIQ